MPTDRLQRQLATRGTNVCASQSDAAIDSLVLLSLALSSAMTVGKETFGPEEVAKVIRFSGAIPQLCQPVVLPAGQQMVWATMGHPARWLSHRGL